MSDTTFLSGDAVDLRPIEEGDLPFLQEAINDPRTWRAIGGNRPINADQEREFFEEVVCDDETVTLMIVGEGTSVGTVGFHTIEWESRRAEVGYWVPPEYHGRGYGGAAAELLVGYGFDQLGLHRIEARVFEFNEASQRLLESVGFTREGVHRDAEFVDGAHQDTYWYGVLEDEWRTE